MRTRGEVIVPAPVDVTWAALADIASHVEWMADAESITFTTDQRQGVGTAYDCLTKVGPLTTVDKMTVTEWVEGRNFGVSHEGMVSGRGLFSLESVAEGTRFTWTEQLRFPVYFGGVIGAFVAKPILRRIWRGNLSRFSALVAAQYRHE